MLDWKLDHAHCLLHANELTGFGLPAGDEEDEAFVTCRERERERGDNELTKNEIK